MVRRARRYCRTASSVVLIAASGPGGGRARQTSQRQPVSTTSGEDSAQVFARILRCTGPRRRGLGDLRARGSAQRPLRRRRRRAAAPGPNSCGGCGLGFRCWEWSTPSGDLSPTPHVRRYVSLHGWPRPGRRPTSSPAGCARLTCGRGPQAWVRHQSSARAAPAPIRDAWGAREIEPGQEVQPNGARTGETPQEPLGRAMSTILVGRPSSRQRNPGAVAGSEIMIEPRQLGCRRSAVVASGDVVAARTAGPSGGLHLLCLVGARLGGSTVGWCLRCHRCSPLRPVWRAGRRVLACRGPQWLG